MPEPTARARILSRLATLLTTHHRALAVIAALIVCAAYLYETGRQTERAHWEARAFRTKRDTVRIRIVETEVRYKRDTIRLVRLVTKWDTARITVERWKHDTLEVVRYVFLADSTIRACQTVQRTCEQLRQLERDRAELAEAELERVRKSGAGAGRRRVLAAVGGAAVGIVAGRLTR